MLIVLSVGIIAIAMAIMAVGVIFKNRCLRGSCGGAEVFDADGEPLSCSACPKRKERDAEIAASQQLPPVAHGHAVPR